MVSMASAQMEFEITVVTGFSRRVRIVAPWKASLVVLDGLRSGEGGLVVGGVGGNRSFAASQSSSTNCIVSLLIGWKWRSLSYFAQVASYTVR